MKAKSILLIITLACTQAQAQKKDELKEKLRSYTNDTSRIGNWYTMSASELIFSGGEVKSGGKTLDNVIRFSAFLHFQQQFHYNFNNTFGLYTGFGLRNVGFINRINISDSLGDVTVKQRSYSLGVPLALKIGNMKKGVFLALGAEAELMFAYKQKILYNDQKYKYDKWFSDKVNIINPSVFADIRFKQGSYIRVKYYLLDFLKDQDMSFIAPTT